MLLLPFSIPAHYNSRVPDEQGHIVQVIAPDEFAGRQFSVVAFCGRSMRVSGVQMVPIVTSPEVRLPDLLRAMKAAEILTGAPPSGTTCEKCVQKLEELFK
jgi:hypothetical protein